MPWMIRQPRYKTVAATITQKCHGILTAACSASEASVSPASTRSCSAGTSRRVRQRGQLPSGIRALGLRHLLHGSQNAPGNDWVCSVTVFLWLYLGNSGSVAQMRLTAKIATSSSTGPSAKLRAASSSALHNTAGVTVGSRRSKAAIRSSP